MQTILVLTDFSENAKHVAEYALELAKKLKADVMLCNTFLIPANVSLTGFSMWPQEEYSLISDESKLELNLLKKHLQNQPDTASAAFNFHPNINVNYVDGSISDAVKSMEAGTNIKLVIAGTHNKDGLSDFLLGNNLNTMIDDIRFPLLLVPAHAVFKPIKKIAFATDLVFINNDENAFYRLVELARSLNAEILVVHVHNRNNNKLESEKRIKNLLSDISNKANYPNIYYRIVNEEVPERGLNWLCENGQVDMLAMVHQDHNLLERIFITSHTQKMAEHIGIPLLILPDLS